MSVTVYGASDDLIEVEGDIREEFYALPDDEPNYVAFSNGVVLRVVYDDGGFWRISPVAGHSHVTVTFATDVDDDYTDRAEVHLDASWVVHGKEFHQKRGRRDS